MKKFQIIFRTGAYCSIASKRIYVSAENKMLARQIAKIELSRKGYVNGFVICAVNPL